MLPGLFAAIFREFVRRFFAEGRVGKKSSFSLDFQCFEFVTYCFRYYFALSLLLLVPFFPRKLVFFCRPCRFCSTSCVWIFVAAFRVGPRFSIALLWELLHFYHNPCMLDRAGVESAASAAAAAAAAAAAVLLAAAVVVVVVVVVAAAAAAAAADAADAAAAAATPFEGGSAVRFFCLLVLGCLSDAFPAQAGSAKKTSFPGTLQYFRVCSLLFSLVFCFKFGFACAAFSPGRTQFYFADRVFLKPLVPYLAFRFLALCFELRKASSVITLHSLLTFPHSLSRQGP